MLTKDNAIEVDITLLPKAQPVNENDHHYLGDAHGNTLYILFFLALKNIILIDAQTYRDFAKLYYEHISAMSQLKNNTPASIALVLSDLIVFHKLLGKIRINPEAIAKNVKLTFVGDEVADRGSNDYFTLCLLELLVDGNVNFEVLFSNHGLEYLRAYHSGNYSRGLGIGQSDSMINLHFLMQRGIVSVDEIKILYKKIYATRLVAFGYQHDPKNNRLILAMHAPNPVRVISDSCEQLGVAFDSSNVLNTLSQLNTRFSQIVDDVVQMDFHFPRGGDGFNYNPLKPLDSLIWCRLEDDNDLENKLRPPIWLGFNTIYIHGHNGCGKVALHKIAYVINLDGIVGKWSQTTGIAGIISYRTQPALALILTQNTASLTPIPPSTKNAERLAAFSSRLSHHTCMQLIQESELPATPDTPQEQTFSVSDLRVPFEVAPSLIEFLSPNQGINIVIANNQVWLDSKGTRTVGVNIFLEQGFQGSIAAVNTLIAAVTAATNKPINYFLDHPKYHQIRLKGAINRVLLARGACLERNNFMSFLSQLTHVNSLEYLDLELDKDYSPEEFLTDVAKFLLPEQVTPKQLVIRDCYFEDDDFINFVRVASNPAIKLHKLDLHHENSLFSYNNMKYLVQLIKLNHTIVELHLPCISYNLREFFRALIENHNSTLVLCTSASEGRRTPLAANLMRNSSQDFRPRIISLATRWLQLVQAMRQTSAAIQVKSAEYDLLPDYFERLSGLIRESEALNKELEERRLPTFTFEEKDECTRMVQYFYAVITYNLEQLPFEQLIFNNPASYLRTAANFAIINPSRQSQFTLFALKRQFACHVAGLSQASEKAGAIASLFSDLERLKEAQFASHLDPDEPMSVQADLKALVDNSKITATYLYLLFLEIGKQLLADASIIGEVTAKIRTLSLSMLSEDVKETIIGSIQKDIIFQDDSKQNLNIIVSSESSSSSQPVEAVQTRQLRLLREKISLLNDTIKSTNFAQFIISRSGLFDLEFFIEDFKEFLTEDPDSLKEPYYLIFLEHWSIISANLQSSAGVNEACLTRFLSFSLDRAMIQLIRSSLENREKIVPSLALIFESLIRTYLQGTLLKEASERVASFNHPDFRSTLSADAITRLANLAGTIYERCVLSKQGKFEEGLKLSLALNQLASSLAPNSEAIKRVDLESSRLRLHCLVAANFPNDRSLLEQKLRTINSKESLLKVINEIKEEKGGHFYGLLNKAFLTSLTGFAKEVEVKTGYQQTSTAFFAPSPESNPPWSATPKTGLTNG